MTKYQKAIEVSANELADKHIAAGHSEPHWRAAVEAQIIRDEMKADGIRAAVLFYGKVSDRLAEMAKEKGE